MALTEYVAPNTIDNIMVIWPGDTYYARQCHGDTADTG